MSASAYRPTPRSVGARFAPGLLLSLLFCPSSGLTQNASHGSPRYQPKTETKARAVREVVRRADTPLVRDSKGNPVSWRTGKQGPH